MSGTVTTASAATAVTHLPPPKNSKAVIHVLIKNIKASIYVRFVIENYIEPLSKSLDVNVQFRGWTLLHYFSYIVTHKIDPHTLGIIQHILANGGNVHLKDPFGRTPIFFQSESTGLFMDYLVQAGAEINPTDGIVKPLHVVASALKKKVLPLIEAGADVYALDKLGRMPLHCALLSHFFARENMPDIENVRHLLDYAPLSTEHPDYFGNYPIYYAFLHGNEEVIDLLSLHTSARVVMQVLQKIKEEITQGTFEPYPHLDDPMYHIDGHFSILIGGGKGSKKVVNKEKIEKETESAAKRAVEETYIVGETTYYLHADQHGGKHMSKGPDLSPKEKQEFIAKTKNENATFYPQFFSQYRQILRQVITKWADAGAPEPSIVCWDYPVGADRGVETCRIELYYGAKLGSHMRPKHLLTNELNGKQESILPPAQGSPNQEKALKKANKDLLNSKLDHQDVATTLVYGYLSVREKFDYFGIGATLPGTISNTKKF